MPWSLCSHTWNTELCSERMNNQTFDDTENSYSLNHTKSKTSSADEYYNIYMLGINHSGGLTDLGYIKIDLLLCLISIFILMYICIYRGVKSTGKNKKNFVF
jgi:solute carrier family 6 GABA transporter-like protein 6/8/11/12/13